MHGWRYLSKATCLIGPHLSNRPNRGPMQDPDKKHSNDNSNNDNNNTNSNSKY